MATQQKIRALLKGSFIFLETTQRKKTEKNKLHETTFISGSHKVMLLCYIMYAIAHTIVHLVAGDRLWFLYWPFRRTQPLFGSPELGSQGSPPLRQPPGGWQNTKSRSLTAWRSIDCSHPRTTPTHCQLWDLDKWCHNRADTISRWRPKTKSMRRWYTCHRLPTRPEINPSAWSNRPSPWNG